MPKKERVQIFIDGANFHYLALKKLKIKEDDFLFDDFVKFLANNRKIVNYGKRYYIGTVREQEGNPESKKAMAKQTKLFAKLKSTNWEIKTSKLRFRMEKVIIDKRTLNYKTLLKGGVKEIQYQRWREKGIDVKLATDLIVGAVDNKYDTAIVISSDGDLIPAVDWVRNRKKKKIEYVGFSIEDPKNNTQNTRPLQSMITYSNIQRILVKSDLLRFVKSKQ